MDVEIFSKASLEKAWKEAKKPSEREHVTFYFWKNPELFSTFRHDLEEDLSNYRLTVDYPEDFELIKSIFVKLIKFGDFFSFDDVIKLCDSNPEILNINKHLHVGFDL